jgi:UDP-glucose 4-epimerase
MAGVDTVVHLAARVHQLREAVQDPLAAHRRVNVDWTRLLAEEAAGAGVRRFVFTSSIKAAGESNTTPWTEATPARPVDPYGISKLEAEVALREIAGRTAMLVPVLRLPLCYGPGIKANMLRLFDAVWRRRPLPLGQVENQRSLLYVGNGVAAIDAVIAAGPAASRLFYVSDDRDLSTPELVRLIGQALGVSPRLVSVPPWLFRLAGRGGDVLARAIPFPLTSGAVDRLLGSLTVDVSALREVTGWTPPYSVEAGLADTAQWYLDRRHTPQET